MSLFAGLLGGAMEGAGQGMMEDAKREELAQQKMELLREKAALRGLGAVSGGPSLSSAARGRSAGGTTGLDQMERIAAMGPEGHDAIEHAGNLMMGDRDTADKVLDYRKAKRAGATTQTDEYDPALADDRDAGEEKKGYTYTLPQYEPGNMAPLLADSQRNLRAAFFGEKLEAVEKGRAEGAVSDAVIRAGKSGKDSDVRAAGALAMAAEGKDRFAVSGNTAYDKAGIEDAKTTEFGEGKLSNEQSAIDQRRVAAAQKLMAKSGGGGGRSGGGGGGGSKATTVAKVLTTADGSAVAVMRDGSTKDLGVSSMDFDKRIDRLAAEASKAPSNFGKEPSAIREEVKRVVAPAKQAAPTGLPSGSKYIGTSGGKPVYQTPDGRKFKAS